MAWGRLALINATKESAQAIEQLANVLGYVKKKSKKNLPPPPDDRLSFASMYGEGGGPEDHFDDDSDGIISKELVIDKYLKIISKKCRASVGNIPDYLTDKIDKDFFKDSEGTYNFGSSDSIILFSQISPFLFNNISLVKASKKLNTKKVINSILNNRPVKKSQYSLVKAWPREIQVIVDTSAHLEPYWHDFSYIVTSLKKKLGDNAVDVVSIDLSTIVEKRIVCLSWPADASDLEKYWDIPASHKPVIILSDLGVNSKNKWHTTSWYELANKFTRDSNILTLSPASSSPKNSVICNIMHPTLLHDKRRLPRYKMFKGYVCNKVLLRDVVSQKPNKLSIINQVNVLLVIISPLPLVDVALLRKIRTQLHLGGSEIEGMVWNHPDVKVTALGAYLNPKKSQKYRDVYASRYANTNLSRELWRQVEEHHKNAYQGLKFLEKLNKYSLERMQPDKELLVYLRNLAATSYQKVKNGDNSPALLGQVSTYLSKCPEFILTEGLEELAHIFIYLKSELSPTGSSSLIATPKGFDAKKVAGLLDTNVHLKSKMHLVQSKKSGKLLITEKPLSKGMTPIGSINYLENLPLSLKKLGDKYSSTLNVNEAIALSSERFTVDSGIEVIDLQVMKKPAWADYIDYNTEHTLEIMFFWRGRSLSLLWIPPLSESKGGWQLQDPDIKDEMSEDENGFYIDVLLASGYKIRFRWLDDKEDNGRGGARPGCWVSESCLNDELFLKALSVPHREEANHDEGLYLESNFLKLIDFLNSVNEGIYFSIYNNEAQYYLSVEPVEISEISEKISERINQYIDKPEGNYLLTVGNISSGKTTFQQHLSQWLMEESESLTTYLRGTSREGDTFSLYQEWKRNWEHNEFPTRTNFRRHSKEFSLQIEPIEESRASVNVNFIEIAGEKYSQVFSDPIKYPDLPIEVSDVLESNDVRICVVLVCDGTQPPNGGISDDVLLSSFLNFLDIYYNGNFDNVAILLLVSKWDEVDLSPYNDEDPLQGFVEEVLPETYNMLLGRPEGTCTISDFSVGSVSHVSNEQSTINEVDFESSERVVKWFYREFTGEELPSSKPRRWKFFR